VKKILSLLLLLTLAGFGVEVSEVIMAKEAIMKKGSNGFTIDGVTNTFPPDSPRIFAIVKYKNAKKNTPIRVSFIAVDATNVPESKIADVDVKTDLPDGVVSASLIRGKQLFPTGRYRVDVYTAGKKIGTHPFEVRGAILPNTPKSAGLGIGVSIRQPKIERIFFARNVTIDEKGMSVPEGISDRFEPSQHTITMVATYSGAKPGDTFLIRAIGVDAGDMHNETLLEDKVPVKLPKGALQQKIHRPDDWPIGTYRIDIYLGGKLLKSKEFQVLLPDTIRSLSFGSSTPTHDSAIPLGRWVASEPGGEQVMEILSPSKIRYNGRSFQCQIDDKNIVIIDGSKRVLYPYERHGDRLTLHYADGKTRTFQRQDKRAQNYDPLSAAERGTPATTALQPLYCCTRAEGNEWVRFEKDGTFSFGSLQDLHTPYGRGKYALERGIIELFLEGGRAEAHVAKWDRDGRIRDIEYEGVVYSSKLCP
jgi:hypothetical protein